MGMHLIDITDLAMTGMTGTILFAKSWWLQPDNLISFAKGIFGLGLVIFVHELGHFLVAKACGVKCEKFYVGFDVPIEIGPFKIPAALFKKQIGETEYGLGTIPLGGYVKMLGQHDNPALAAEEAEKAKVADEEGDYQMDPRSYLAKSVPQRMAIISAGVIMNLITAVLFAAMAYKMGLRNTPAVVGRTMPGDSAWQAGVRPGDHMVQLGKEGRRDEYLRFNDLRFSVIKKDENSFPMTVRRLDGTEHVVNVQPVSHKGEIDDTPKIGVYSASTNKFFENPFNDGSAANQSDLRNGDIIKEMIVDGADGVSAEIDGEINGHVAMKKLLLANRDKSITLVVDRKEDPKSKTSPAEELKLKLAPQPLRYLGFATEMGPIVAIQTGSPAETAGFQAGDVLLSIDGESISDPLLVESLLVAHVGKQTTFGVKRGDEELELSATVRAADMEGDVGRGGGPVAAEALGIAYQVTDKIASVVPGGPAESAGVQVGDIVTGFHLKMTEAAELEKKLQQTVEQPIKFGDERPDWGYASVGLQFAPKGTDAVVTFRRGTESIEKTMTPVDYPGQYEVMRGLRFEQLSRVKKAASVGDALRLGFRETKEGIEQVFVTLSRIGKLYKHMGGPGTILYAATAEASEGLPRLLGFLTLLSANLAVLNFLPIPVLDGGHMMFLLYEGIFGKPMNERIAFAATMAGLCLVLCLLVFMLGLDFFRFSGLLGMIV